VIEEYRERFVRVNDRRSRSLGEVTDRLNQQDQAGRADLRISLRRQARGTALFVCGGESATC
jgi:hypothetical protein